MIKVELKSGTYYNPALILSFKYDAKIVQMVKDIDGRRYNPSNYTWEFPTSKIADIINKFKDSLDFKFNVAEYIEQKPKQNYNEQELLAEFEKLNFEFKTTPFEHQKIGFMFGLKNEKLLIGDEQGLGKTWQSLNIALARKQMNGCAKCLIICGVNSIKYNWVNEIKIHSNEDVIIIDGTLEKRKELIQKYLNSNVYFAVINIESLRKDDITNLFKDKIDMAILDEAHKAKNPTSQQGKAIHKINARYKLALTGTPIMNKADEIYNIMKWLEIEHRNFFAFKRTYCIFGGYGNYQIVGYKNLDDLKERLHKIMLRRKKEEVLNLPSKIKQVNYVEMTEKQKLIYKQVRDNLIVEIDDILLSPNPLAKLIRLRQVTSGILGDLGMDAKTERLLEILEETVRENNKKVIIFSAFEQVAQRINEIIKNEGYKTAYITGKIKDRQAEVDKFQNSDTNIIIGTIGAMGTGLTLNKAEYVIFMDKAWTPADNEQAEDRSHRIGTKNTVNIISLVAKDTIDEAIEELLSTKKDLFNKIVEGNTLSKNDKETLVKMLLNLNN